MARNPRNSAVVDGFTALQAARRAQQQQAGAGPPSSHAGQVEAPKAAPRKRGEARIGHTVRPAKHNVICYECSFSFTITGLLQNTYCPKCRSLLAASEYSIDREWSGIIRTIGVVSISSQGVVTGGKIIAGNVVLAGRIEAGQVRVCGRLELREKGSYDPGAVKAGNLVVGPGAESSFPGELALQDLEVRGTLKAEVNVAGCAIVRAGGMLKGRITGSRLIVEEGGGLKAKLTIVAKAADSSTANGSFLALQNDAAVGRKGA